jgi:hypothetical protein
MLALKVFIRVLKLEKNYFDIQKVYSNKAIVDLKYNSNIKVVIRNNFII